MKKIIETVAEGGNELGVHMYPFSQSSRGGIFPSPTITIWQGTGVDNDVTTLSYEFVLVLP